MAFKPVGTSNTIDLKKEPQNEAHEGIYIGFKKINTKIGEQTIWQFKSGDGEIFGFYGFTHLNIQMENVKEGVLCRITYQGTKRKQTKFGMKDVHQVLVECDEDSEPEEKVKDVPF